MPIIDGNIDVRWWVHDNNRLIKRDPVLVKWAKKTGFKNLVPIPIKSFSEKRFYEKHSKYFGKAIDKSSEEKRDAKFAKIQTAILAVRKLQDLIKKRNEIKETLSRNALSLSQKAKTIREFNKECHSRARYEFKKLEVNLNKLDIYLHLSETMQERFPDNPTNRFK